MSNDRKRKKQEYMVVFCFVPFFDSIQCLVVGSMKLFLLINEERKCYTMIMFDFSSFLGSIIDDDKTKYIWRIHMNALPSIFPWFELPTLEQTK